MSSYGFVTEVRAEIYCLDGYDGLPSHAPFDKIIVAAAAEQLPRPLLEQLKPGGRLLMPVGKQGEPQDLVVVDKALDGQYRQTKHPGFLFVPLIKNN